MKLWLITAVTIAGLTTSAMAQDSDNYSNGYNAGYNDSFPIGGLPSPITDYGKGFQQGQDDSYDDDRIEMERQSQYERDLRTVPMVEPLTADPEQ